MAGCKSQPQKNGQTVIHADSSSLRWTVTDWGTEVVQPPYPTADGLLTVDGFWVSTSESKKLPLPLAVKIECDRSQGVCREIGAQVSYGVLAPSLTEYTISSWTQTSVIADDHGMCSMAHRLTVNFTTKSVTVADYPTAVDPNQSKFCQQVQDVGSSSYVLHDGAITLNQPAPFDQSGIRR